MGTTDDVGVVLEGFVDLIFREPDGRLGIIDYKTDMVPDAALPVRVRHYTPQIRAYQRAVEAATGAETAGWLVFLDPTGAPGRVVQVPGAWRR